ncbi:hypothetical protein [Halopolyspora algeriensis]|nr:hypothetical protein [Halopolyspora algeriensis]
MTAFERSTARLRLRRVIEGDVAERAGLTRREAQDGDKYTALLLETTR